MASLNDESKLLELLANSSVVKDLQELVKKLEIVNNTLQTDVVGLQTANNSLQTNVGGLQAQVDEHELRLNGIMVALEPQTLQAMVETASHKYIEGLGDPALDFGDIKYSYSQILVRLMDNVMVGPISDFHFQDNLNRFQRSQALRASLAGLVEFLHFVKIDEMCRWDRHHRNRLSHNGDHCRALYDPVAYLASLAPQPTERAPGSSFFRNRSKKIKNYLDHIENLGVNQVDPLRTSATPTTFATVDDALQAVFDTLASKHLIVVSQANIQTMKLSIFGPRNNVSNT